MEKGTIINNWKLLAFGIRPLGYSVCVWEGNLKLLVNNTCQWIVSGVSSVITCTPHFLSLILHPTVVWQARSPRKTSTRTWKRTVDVWRHSGHRHWLHQRLYGCRPPSNVSLTSPLADSRDTRYLVPVPVTLLILNLWQCWNRNLWGLKTHLYYCSYLTQVI